MLEFIVVSGGKNTHPTVIGLYSLLKLNLIKRVETIVELSEK